MIRTTVRRVMTMTMVMTMKAGVGLVFGQQC